MSTTPAHPHPSTRWLFNPTIDLLAGCGLGYVAVFVLLVAAGASVMELLPLHLLPLIALVAGGPHYGATLVRVYYREEDRRRYVSVAFGWTLVLVAAFLVSFRVHALGSALVTLYLLWSPWHYASQNFGLGLMFMGRRGIQIDARTRALLRASFLLPFALFIVQANGAADSSFANLGFAAFEPIVGGPTYRSVPLGMARSWQATAMLLLVLGYFGAVLGFALRARREATLRDLLPTFALIATQSLWFAAPACARYWGWGIGIVPLDSMTSLYAFQWVAAAHAIQYIWVTLYYNSRNSEGVRRSKRHFFLKSALVGQAVWVLPTFVFARAFDGPGTYSADLAILVAAVVNLHHFVLDGAVWKLRDSSVAKALMKGARRSNRQIGRTGYTPLRVAGYAMGGLLFCVELSTTLERHAFHTSTASGNLQRAEISLERLERMRRVDSALYFRYAKHAEGAGDPDAAVRSFERSAVVGRNPAAYTEMGRLQAERGDWAAAADSFERAYALVPLPAQGYLGMGRVLLQAGRVERARVISQEAVEKFPENAALLALHAQIRARS